MPIEPSTITFYFGHFQTTIRRRVHCSNIRHISNQLPAVCNQTIVVNLAYRLMNQNKNNGFQYLSITATHPATYTGSICLLYGMCN